MVQPDGDQPARGGRGRLHMRGSERGRRVGAERLPHLRHTRPGAQQRGAAGEGTTLLHPHHGGRWR